MHILTYVLIGGLVAWALSRAPHVRLFLEDEKQLFGPAMVGFYLFLVALFWPLTVVAAIAYLAFKVLGELV